MNLKRELMNNWILFTILASVLTNCSVNKMLDHELFLSIDSSESKIYIISSLPVNYDSSAIFTSTILLNNKIGNDHQITAFTYVYKIEKNQSESAFFFVDTINSYVSNTFPLLLNNSNFNSQHSDFIFELDRNSLMLNAKSKKDNNQTEYSFAYPKKQTFKTTNIETKFGINEIEPFEAHLKKVNNVEIDLSAFLSVHVIENGNILFDKTNNKKYYWLNFQDEDKLAYSLFFEANADGKNTLIFSTHPKFNSLCESDFNKGEDFIAKIMDPESHKSIVIKLIEKKTTEESQNFKFENNAVTIYNDQNELIGNGIFYKL